jgi:hypothetical protein
MTLNLKIDDQYMGYSIRTVQVLICLPLLLTLCACGQGDKDSKSGARQRPWTHKELVFTTPAYNKEALRLIIEEANRVARELNLPEKLPITEADLVEIIVPPPRIGQGMKAIGNITTSNYFYAVYSGKRFSLVRTHMQEEYNQLQKEYLWPMSRMDTNAAYNLATQWLSAGMSLE